MSTSAISRMNIKRKYLKTIFVYLGMSCFCIFFNFIYEKFSYGEFSIYMRLMFLVPLIGGGLVFLAAYFPGITLWANRKAYNLWNSGIAVLTSGCLIKGIIDISGRFTEYDRIYWLAGVTLLLVSVIMYRIRA